MVNACRKKHEERADLTDCDCDCAVERILEPKERIMDIVSAWNKDNVEEVKEVRMI